MGENFITETKVNDKTIEVIKINIKFNKTIYAGSIMKGIESM